MKTEFDKLDPENSGKVSNGMRLHKHDWYKNVMHISLFCLQVRGADFLQVLKKFDLHLKREHLGLFLSRCGLKLKKGCVQYLNFLRRFQDRSSDGITHKIISNPKHRSDLYPSNIIIIFIHMGLRSLKVPQGFCNLLQQRGSSFLY